MTFAIRDTSIKFNTTLQYDSSKLNNILMPVCYPVYFDKNTISVVLATAFSLTYVLILTGVTSGSLLNLRVLLFDSSWLVS